MCSNTLSRIKSDYFERVRIPEEFSKYLWDYREETPLEVLILSLLRYGKFDEIERLYNLTKRN